MNGKDSPWRAQCTTLIIQYYQKMHKAGCKDISNRESPTGDFLRAVLENKLVESFGRADDQNIRAMFQYASFLYNEAPRDSWGSAEAVDNWLIAKQAEKPVQPET